MAELSAVEYDLTLEKGSTKSIRISHGQGGDVLYDLTGFKAYLQVRVEHEAGSTLLLDLSTDNGKIIYLPDTRQFLIRFLGEDTVKVKGSKGYYDLYFVTSLGDPVKRMFGSIAFVENVTVIP